MIQSAAPRSPETTWWALTADEALAALVTPATGLSTAAAARRLAESGRNELPEAAGPGVLRLFARQFASPLVYILVFAAIVTAALSEYIDASIITAAVIFDAVIGFVQEYGAERSMNALRRLATTRARVLRDGREHEIDARDVVPGDVILIEAGARVPADCRLLHTAALEVDESLLTGESATVAKHAATVAAGASLPDRLNMAFMGTAVTRGRGRALAVATGMRTQLGAVAGAVREIGEPRAPLQARVDRLARIIGVAGLVLFVVGFAGGLAAGNTPSQTFRTLVALAVSAVPEGLPIVLTVTLAIAVTRMARRNVIIRRLPTVETLGSCTVIGSDKTGTLTENRMTVQALYAGGQVYRVSGLGYEAAGEITLDGEPVRPAAGSSLYATLLAGVLCNDASIVLTDNEFAVQGDPTEVALLVAATKAGLFKDELADLYPRIAEIPFDPTERYAATVHRVAEGDLVFVKGAPERVLTMCSDARGDGGTDRDAVLAAARSFADAGLRVLATAWTRIERGAGPADRHVHLAGLTFAGLHAMMDPPRAEARAAVLGCRRAGIRVVMITGDHASTARAVAASVGIAGAEARVVTGDELEGLDDAALDALAEESPVFARALPHHKLGIIRALQRRGGVVAATGDGVNDAPALKAADIGVAMGRSGTEVAKQAADMVITDDNFASIFAAVEEGRVAFDNVRKVTFLLISTGVAEIVAVLSSIAFGFRLPFVPAQLLWLNLVTNGVQDVALAFEPGDPDVLERPPRPRREGVISALLWERTALVGAIMAAGTLLMYLLQLRADASTEHARTVALTTMVLFQVFHIGNCRSEYVSAFRKSPLANRFLFVGTTVAVATHVAALYLPPTQYILRVEPLPLSTWPTMLGVALSVVIAVELHKILRRPKASDPDPLAAKAPAGA